MVNFGFLSMLFFGFLVSIFIYAANGLNNVCADCSRHYDKDCKVNEHVMIATNSDRHKIHPLSGNEKTDPDIEACFLEGFTLTGENFNTRCPNALTDRKSSWQLNRIKRLLTIQFKVAEGHYWGLGNIDDLLKSICVKSRTKGCQLVIPSSSDSEVGKLMYCPECGRSCGCDMIKAKSAGNSIIKEGFLLTLCLSLINIKLLY